MTQPAASGDAVQRQIEVLRRKLLDLTMRNRMLNYRPSKRLGIDIFGEDSFYLHRLVVEEGKKMSFVGKPDAPRRASQPRLVSDDAVLMSDLKEEAVDELNAFLVNPVVPVDQLDTKLNTSEFESVLQAKLRTMMREAHEVNQGLGINTLFLTLGMLEWSETSDKTFRSPLLFIPVTLEQQKNGAIRLVHDGSDVGANLPLKAKLQELNLKLPEWDEDKGVHEYLNEVESTIRLRKDWQVARNDVCLGFFNYEKYAMYVDLGGDAWPADRKPWLNPDLKAMFGEGYKSQASSVGDDTFLDAVRPLSSSLEVFDADGSQTIAMIRAAEGLSIVVEGPPGTGKSQTITNMIAEAVAAGKSVLFVSAKRAALEVVRRNMEKADLGAACLDLHDKLTNRREFYAEIKKTVERGVTLKADGEKVARLGELRDRLNAHSAAVNEPLAEFGCTPFEAMTFLAGLPAELAEDREGRIPFEHLRAFDQAQIRAALPLVKSLQARLEAVGVPIQNVFWGAEIDYLDPARRLDLDQDIELARKQVNTALEKWNEACAALCVEILPSLDNARVLRVCAERALAAPPIDGLSVKASTWRRDEPAIRTTIAALRLRNEIRAALGNRVKPEIWAKDLVAIQQAYEEHATQWYRFVFGAFRKAQTELTPYTSGDPASQLEVVRQVRKVQQAEAEVASQQNLMASLFGVQWRGVDSDPNVLERLLQWVLELYEKIDRGEIPPGLLDFFSGESSDAGLIPLVESAERAAQEAVEAYIAVAKVLEFPCQDALSEAWKLMGDCLAAWQSSLPTLPSYIAYSEARRQVLVKDLASVVDLGNRWPLASERLSDAFLRSYYAGVVREAMQKRPELKTFEREGHEAAIAEFQSLDDFKLRYNRAQVRLAHFQQMPTFDNAVGNLHLLKLQCELQRRHKPIRYMMSLAGEAIQRIKPVFMMSPLTVAIHLPPEMPLFDMVIFDEASQIKPEDALCAIARAKQSIVVGDTRQMPPTSFFDRLVDDDEVDPEEEEGLEIGQEARKLESVLSLMSAVAMGSVRRPDLRWHYRSIHPSLIQPSNEMFYGNRLIVFPSPGRHAEGRRIGMVFHHHPETAYEPGAKNRVNRREAELIADRVLEHVKTNPGESLLVAAMNKPQADLIYDEVAKRERLAPAAFEAYRTRHPHEPIDVKNLETVQGDERDVVYISVTYGRDSSGVLRQQFGPLLQDGGERRLNVLFTRARRRCEVFSNISSDDIRSEAGRLGVATLKKYLQFAQTGILDTATPTGGAEESPFEEEVVSALRDRGYEVHCQVGSEGYRIDLGVVDRETPGRYVLGVECDGATYHSARSARDRDKLRQKVLEGRGWNLHRIWSHDWWQDREGEIRRLIEAIENASNAEVSADQDSVIEEPIVLQEGERTAEDSSTARPYVVTEAPEANLDSAGLAGFFLEVVQTEGPIHRDLLLIRLRDAAGIESVRSATRRRLEDVIESSLSKVLQIEDAILANESQLSQARDWSNLPSAERKIEYVTQPELAAALKAVVRKSFGVSDDEAKKAALRLLGFKRATETAVDRIDAVLLKLIEGGDIKSDGQKLMP